MFNNMKITLKKFCVVIIFAGVFSNSAFCGDTSNSSISAYKKYQSIENKKFETWWGDYLKESFKDAGAHCYTLPALFEESREKRDFPNSMVVSGMTIEEHEKMILDELESIMKKLSVCDEKEYMAIVRAMQHQKYDDEISKSADELVVRLKKAKQDKK